MTQSFNVNVGGTFTPVTKPSVNIGGTWTPVSIGWVNVAGTWVEFFVLLPTVNAFPVSAQATGFGVIYVTTGIVTATATGGTGTYVSYVWSFQSGGGGLITTSPNTASTAWSAHLTPGDDFNGYAICTVTDSGGNVGVSNGVEVGCSSTN